MSVIQWTDVDVFIDARDPSFRASTVGVPRDEIAECEEALGVELPHMYVDFLCAMGESCGAFGPFGAFQVCNFYQLFEDFPPETYPYDKYFKVAFDNDRSIVVHLDTFIDLKNSDGHDAQLVVFEDFGEFSEDSIRPQGFTLVEQLTRRVFDFFELRRHAHRSFLRVPQRLQEDVVPSRQLLFEQIAKLGLGAVWSPQARVACFHDGKLSALFEHRIQTNTLTVRLGAANRNTLRLAAEQIRDRFPNVTVDDD